MQQGGVTAIGPVARIGDIIRCRNLFIHKMTAALAGVLMGLIMGVCVWSAPRSQHTLHLMQLSRQPQHRAHNAAQHEQQQHAGTPSTPVRG